MEKLMCEHCWHIFNGPIMIVIPSGHVLQQCCVCNALRTIHMEHLDDRRVIHNRRALKNLSPNALR